MKAGFAVSYKEPSWEWEDAPTTYFPTFDEANNFYQRAIRLDVRFRCFRLDEIKDSGEWVKLEEIDLGPQKNSN
jgi:hypothetical protein